MADLEDLLREACKRGLTHLSLHPTTSADEKKVYWRCTATPSTMHKYVSVNDEDPVAAVTEVLKAMPKAPKRTTKVDKPTDPHQSDLVTAAVIDGPTAPAAVNPTSTISDDTPPDWFNT